MDYRIFNELLPIWKSNEISWTKELADKYGYTSSEGLRSSFRRERKKRGITKDSKEISEVIQRKSPKILVFDLENSYVEAAVWGIHKQYINKAQILKDWFLLSYSAQWLYDPEIYSSSLTSKESLDKDDKRITGEMWDLLDEADIAITYNGNLFDIPKINTRFLLNNFTPPTPYRSIDVYQTVSRVFSITSNTLDYVNTVLESERKIETDFQLWKDCVAGNSEALHNMEIYNRQDVTCLVETYLKIRPWIRNHPNIGLWHDSLEPRCGFCGSTEIEWISNLYTTPTGLYKSFRCQNCGGVGRNSQNTLDLEKRRSLLRNS